MNSLHNISIFIVIYNGSLLYVCKHTVDIYVQGMPMCPKCGDVCVRASVYQRPTLVRPSGQQAQSSVPHPSSCQLILAVVKMGVGCHCHYPPQKVKVLCFPGRECLQNMYVANGSLG